MKNNLEVLLSPKTIRSQSKKIFDLCLNGGTHFQYNENQFDSLCEFVIEVIEENYPNWDIPYHGRINHLNANGIDRTSKFSPESLIDLIFVSVLLDAGAGADWSFRENGVNYTRSEGLAVASHELFLSGLITTENKLDSDKLESLTKSQFEKIFQVETNNPLVGVDGRLGLIKKLASVKRPGLLLKSMPKSFEVKDLLIQVLKEYHSIWPKRVEIEGVNIADMWKYNFTNGEEFIPFHKLSQWLTYSLVEPFEKAGFSVLNLDSMTGLPEYRNGGLLLDASLLSLRNSDDLEKTHSVESPLIVEWRALTIVLLDKIADRIREIKNKNAKELPLVKILEGGTWQAGRKLAQQKREGLPPLKLNLTGTVF